MGWEVKIPHTQTLNDNVGGGGCNNKKKHYDINIDDISTFQPCSPQVMGLPPSALCFLVMHLMGSVLTKKLICVEVL